MPGWRHMRKQSGWDRDQPGNSNESIHNHCKRKRYNRIRQNSMLQMHFRNNKFRQSLSNRSERRLFKGSCCESNFFSFKQSRLRHWWIRQDLQRHHLFHVELTSRVLSLMPGWRHMWKQSDWIRDQPGNTSKSIHNHSERRHSARL